MNMKDKSLIDADVNHIGIKVFLQEERAEKYGPWDDFMPSPAQDDALLNLLSQIGNFPSLAA